MSLKDYLKDKMIFLLVNFVLSLGLAVFFLFLRIKVEYIVLVVVVWFTPLIVLLLLQYLQRKSYYDNLYETIESLDKKYLLSEIIEEANFIDGKIIYDILKISDKEMHEHVKYYKKQQSEYREYIEAWVHEVKTPIASSKLIVDNNRNSVTKSIKEELLKIEDYVEEVLYYSRSNDANKDYIIKEFNLGTVVKNIVTKNSKDFIHRRIKLNLQSVDNTVYSDSKWVEFIINQILSNAIKYSDKDEAEIKIFSEKRENNIILSIEDNGVGINERDIKRVFDKGFTGENGRKYGRSTGMGLYICSNLGKKLGIGIEITSKIGEGTKVDIIFPMSKVTLLEN
ncbi:sensor histidine kinase [Clostridium paraputrificum]|uniref:sensor histidine kinase n=1 Tax=Clostridium TaxID=1485 RepID=UPI003D32BA7D